MSQQKQQTSKTAQHNQSSNPNNEIIQNNGTLSEQQITNQGNKNSQQKQDEKQQNVEEDKNKDQLDQINIENVKVNQDDQSDTQMQKFESEDAQKAQQYKNKGNQLFKNEQSNEAIAEYQKGLKYTNDKTLRATLLSNMAISYIKIQQYKNAKKYCLKVLKQDENHKKGRMNLARCYEQQKKIEQAFQQYKKLEQNMEGATDKDIKYVKQKIAFLKPKIDELNQSRKKQVMDGLKNIGNSILGYFGMSLDNFKLEQGANGGYNVSFKQ